MRPPPLICSMTSGRTCASLRPSQCFSCVVKWSSTPPACYRGTLVDRGHTQFVEDRIADRITALA
jgi:hypothetical protein